MGPIHKLFNIIIAAAVLAPWTSNTVVLVLAQQNGSTTAGTTDTDAAAADDAATQQLLHFQKCALAIQGFEFFKFDEYDQWLSSTSVLELAQAGTYAGAEDIREYIMFTVSEYFDYYIALGNSVPVPIQASEKECVFMFVITNQLQVNAELAAPRCLQFPVAYKFFFSLEDESFGGRTLINRINIFYTNAFLQQLFGAALDYDGVAQYICNILEANCQDTYKLNNLTPESCMTAYQSLPLTGELGDNIDDNSKGCRVLHSTFATTNTDHCPHLSFVPEVDKNNVTKCQTSYNISTNDLFSQEELAIITGISVTNFSFPADTLVRECEYDAAKAREINCTFAGDCPTTTEGSSTSSASPGMSAGWWLTVGSVTAVLVWLLPGKYK